MKQRLLKTIILLLIFGFSIPKLFADVTKTVGVSGANYATLKAAFDAINAGTIKTGVITLNIIDNTTEAATAVLYQSGYGGVSSYTSVEIYPTVNGKTISGNLAAPLIDLNGADNVTIDGRVNATGSIQDLTITNTSNSGIAGTSTIRFINTASNNAVQYCNIKGSELNTTSAVVFFSTATAGTGNDNNIIIQNNITSSTDANRPINAISSVGSSGYENSENTINYNSIYNFINRANASYGINLGAYTTDCTITGNSFYETASFVPTSNVEYRIINIDNSLGNSFSVNSNYIGGNTELCGGTFSKTNAKNNTFTGIYLNVGTSSPTNINNNTIQNFAYSNSANAAWIGVSIAGGVVNIGVTNGNTIGAATGTGSITVTNSTTDGNVYGIFIASVNTVSCKNNDIGSITTSTGSTLANNLYGIYKAASAGTTIISENIIGSETTSNSLNTSSAATANSQMLVGVYSAGTGSVTISGNTISNITNSTTETTVASKVRGILTVDGSNIIQSNDVNHLKTSGAANGSNYTDASLIGICQLSTTAGTNQSIISNSVNNLENTSTAKIEMYGIYYAGSATGTNIIERNFIHTFIVTTTDQAYLHGISLYDGTFTVSNNIVYLGNNITTGCFIWGIWTNSNDAIGFYHNTVYLSGVATTGTSNTYAFRSLNASPTFMIIENNILWNDRTNSGGTVSHFAIFLQSQANTATDYNDFKFAQQFGKVGATAYSTFALWKTGTSLDANSMEVDPLLINLGGTLPSDYQTTVALIGSTNTGITTDIDYVVRSVTAPTIGAWEYFANPVEVWNGATYRASYTTLKGAFDKINDGTWTGTLIIKFKGNTTETTTAALYQSGYGGVSNYTQILIYPSRRGVRVTGALAMPLVDLNGADNVTFDGRVTASGEAYEFTLSNTGTSATAGTSTIRFINDAGNNTFQYCNIKGSSTDPAAGIIFFSTTSGTIGNDGNTIDNNNITNSATANRPINAVYSAGTATKENSGNTISNNNIFDFWRLGSDSYGINLNANTTDNTINANSFYETTAFVPTGTYSYNAIRINNASGNNFTVSNNYIGGQAALCGGSALSLGATGTVQSVTFYPIYLSAGTTTASSVQGNTVQNINYRSSSASPFAGINVSAGAVNIGTVTENTLGAATGIGSLLLTSTSNATNSYGIYISSTGSVNVTNNTIASITAANSTASYAHNFYGIYKSGVTGTLTINANAIGSATVGSVQTSSVASASGNAQNLYGIYSDGTGYTAVSQNVIYNLTNATTNANAGTAGRVVGIVITAGTTDSVAGNTIRDLSIANANTAATSSASVIGLLLSGTTPIRKISNNIIYNLSNTYGSFAGMVVGLYYEGSTSGTNTVSENFIHSLSTSGTSGASLFGIWIVSGVTTYSNNIINLGGTVVSTNRDWMYGIYDTGTASQTCNLYFNTVYIGGSGFRGIYNSYALYNSSNSNTRNYRNNIFYNARSRSNDTSKHYAMYIQTAGGGTLTVDYNDYRATGTGGMLGYYGVDVAAKPIVTGQDVNSLITNPAFVSAGSTVPTDYMTTVYLDCVTGTGIGLDFDTYSRGVVPTMGAWEFRRNKWVGTNSIDWNTASNWSGNLVPVTNATILFDPAPVRHCQLDQNRTVTNIINAQSTYRMVLNGFKITVKGNLGFTNGAEIDASATNSNIEFAGTSQNIPTGSFYNDNVFNLTINNRNNVTLNGTLNLLNTITSTSGRLDAKTNLPTVCYAGTSAQNIEANRFLNDSVYDLTINNALGVTLNADFAVDHLLTINFGKVLTIPTARELNVVGTITNSAGAPGLVIKASSSAANGTLIFHNPFGSPVSATVEMYSKATYNLSNPVGSKYKWQYFGIPFRTLTTLPWFFGAYVRQWDETGVIPNHWIQLGNSSSLSSFLGYEIVQEAAKTYVFEGVLENSDANFGQLSYTSFASYPGQHILANPYTAAIDITQVTFGPQMEHTVYLYNTGSYNDWYTTGGVNTNGDNSGQYISVPQNQAGYGGLPDQVPSMQAFLVKALSNSTDATLAIPYNSVLKKNTQLQRSKELKAKAINKVYTKIEIKGSRFSDRMWLFIESNCTHKFDNGWDGPKLIGSSLAPQLFARESDGDYQINSVDDLNNTYLGFKAGEDSIYSLSFSNVNTQSKYPNLYLVDLQRDSTIDISQSQSDYTFTVLKTDTLQKRFKIVTSKEVPTAVITPKVERFNKIKIYCSGKTIFVDNQSGISGFLMVYDLSGVAIQKHPINASGVTTIQTKLAVGAYIVKGIVAKIEVSEQLLIR